jgi:hypothetical protein
MNVPDIEIVVAEEKAKPKRRGGHRPGAGRPSLVRENKKRMEMGLEPILPKQTVKKRHRKSKAILPEASKARSQEILAEMLGRKSASIVQVVLDKALREGDPDQMACLKIVMDRILPPEYFTKNKNKSNAINIQIMGVGMTSIESSPSINEQVVEDVDE